MLSLSLDSVLALQYCQLLMLNENLQVAVGDVVYIEANSGAVKRVGRSDAFATEFDLEAEEYVPLPKGEVHKKKEIVQVFSYIFWVLFYDSSCKKHIFKFTKYFFKKVSVEN